MIRKVIVVAVTVLALLSASTQAPVQGAKVVFTDASVGRLVPVPKPSPFAISTELNYSGFPFTLKTSKGKFLTAYKSSATHNDHGGNLTFRWSNDGVAWGNPYQMPGQVPGYSWGHGGIAAETEAQGGRIYINLLRLHFRPGTAQVDQVLSWIKWSEDDGVTWTLGPQFPPITTTGWYPSSLIVLSDGTLLSAGYNTDGWIRYTKSLDRGATWITAGAVRVEGRGVAEGTLAQLDDGRVISILRSDVPDKRLYWTISSDALTWATPVVASLQASGLANPTVLPNGHVVVPYRGYVDVTKPEFGTPTRLMMFNVTEAGLSLYRENVDPWLGQDKRYLYGNVIQVPDGYLLIVGIEGPAGQDGGSAQVVAIPLEFRTI